MNWRVTASPGIIASMGAQTAAKLLRSGREALAAAEWETARSCFEQALETEESVEALDGLGDAVHWLGEYDRAIELKERAFVAYQRAGRPLEASGQARLLAFLHGAVRGNDAVANGWFARAESLLEGMDDTVAHGWIAFERAPLSRDVAERERLATTALALARRFGDADLEFVALALLGEAYVESGRTAEGMTLIDQAMAAVSSGEVTWVVAVGEIYCRFLSACELTSDVRRAEQWMSVVDRFVAGTRSLLVSTTCRLHYGGILIAIGRWEEAEEELTAAIRLSETSYRAMRVFPLVRLAELRVRQGRLEEAERLIEGNEWHPVARRSLAAIALARGELALAEELARMCVDGAEPNDPSCALLHELLVDVQLARGDTGAAERTVAVFAELAEASGNDRARAYTALAKGRVLAARGDERASACLQTALELFSTLDLPLEAGKARLALARAIATAAPDASEAEARLALAAFERLGAVRYADAAAGLLRELGATGRAWPKNYGTLTKRETEVLSLLAGGCSNAEIADRLVISRRTAEHHVASILSKLDLRSRAEAAAYAVRELPERPVAG
jgi:DNA-binding CsgD family transcriptional regulator